MLQHVGMWIGNKLIAQSDEQGAWPTLYAATQDIPGDSYVGPDGFQEGRGHPTLVGRSDAARRTPDVRAARCGSSPRQLHRRQLPARRLCLSTFCADVERSAPAEP